MSGVEYPLAGIPAVPQFYDRKPYWPAASLERRGALLASIAAAAAK